MQPGLQRQERQYYKNKVSDIISSYERQQQEEQRLKANIKKQIMLTILNNRKIAPPEPHQKSEAERTDKTSLSEEAPSEATFKNNQAALKSALHQAHSDARFESEESRHTGKLEEITFNAKKRNKSLEEELTFKESYLNLLRERRLREELPREREEEENPSDKYASNDYPPVQRSVYKSSHSSEEGDYLPNDQEKPSKNSILQKYSYFKESLVQPRQRSHHSEEEEDKRYQYEGEEEEEEGDPREREEQGEIQKQEEHEQRGVFLTMEESESMVAEDAPKNYAFEIKMDKSTNPSDLEQLKKQRIKEIERKRQERIEEFRRNESQKKVEMPRGKNSYSKKAERDHLNESDAPPPRSATIERKNNPSVNVATQHRNESSKAEREYPRTIPVESQESQYSIRPFSSKQLPPNPSYHPDPEPRPPTYKQPRTNFEGEKPLSPFRTPKSMAPDNTRGKSTGKNANPTIFAAQEGREKSSNKHEAKIEPKDRKNSFTRQSNKKQMVNAITYVVFPGELNRKERERLTEIIEGSQHEFFVFLFKEYSRKMIKGIYVFDSSQTVLRRIHGEKSPPEITAEMVQEFYKYDNGSREFKRLDGCRSFSFSISAIDLRK